MRTTALCAGALAWIAWTGTPAQAAAPIEHDTYHDVFSFNSVDDPEWPCAIDVQIDGDIRGNFVLGAHQPGSLPLGHEAAHGTVSYSANDSTYTGVFSVLNRDMSVTENTDGSLTVLVMGTGVERWFLNGERIFMDSGQLRLELHVTNPGTDQEEAHVVRIIRESNGVNDGPTRTFCEDIEEFLAPTT
jgi:hypothetical protein